MKIAVIPGDGIGPEVVQAAVRIVDELKLGIEWIWCEAGAKVFAKNIASGVAPETVEAIRQTKVALKGPLETPIGYGGKSANVTLRKLFEAYGNIRPTRELPGVVTPFSGRNIDLVVVRENIEDLYAGIEHMQTPGVAQCLKLVSREGCEKILRLAFELARSQGRPTIHCATKANIMKLTEGMMKRVFEEMATEYPEIEAHHILIDNCAHQLVIRPEQFSVIVTTNMNGDIISDLASGLVGGLGFAPSANIGDDVAIFEAVHGSAPDIAGRDIANPTAIILSAAMMLRHIGHSQAASAIENAVLVTLSRGIRTADITKDGSAVGTMRFAEHVIHNLDEKHFHASEVKQDLKLKQRSSSPATVKTKMRRVIGVDVFIESDSMPNELGENLKKLLEESSFTLQMISNRGMMVYPSTSVEIGLVDHWRCRFITIKEEVKDRDIIDLLKRINEHYRWMHIEKLNEFDGEAAFSKGQGQG